MSGKAPKQKGNRIERECVNTAKGFGFESKRAWGSDGRSLGWHEEVDMVIDISDKSLSYITNPSQEKHWKFKFQVKGRKAIADYLKPCEHVYGQILKEDRKETLVVLRYVDLLTLFKRLAG
jgi:Holliday junction resolvase